MLRSLRKAGPGGALRLLAGLALCLGVLALGHGDASAQSSVRPPEPPASLAPAEPGEARLPDAPADPSAPEGEAGGLAAQGGTSDAELWHRVRRGEDFTISIPDDRAAILVQDEGVEWVGQRGEGSKLRVWGGWAMAAMIGLLLIFYLLRGRIRIQSGRSGRKIRRFTGLERFSHWLMAVSFIILAVTGLNLLYGRGVLLDLFGAETYALLAGWGKIAHNTVAFAFMLGIVLSFVLWIAHNLPSRTDLKWIAQGGGMFSKHKHPPAKKFNFGQKIVFWSVVVLGLSISASGIALMFPFEVALFDKTFTAMNAVGFEMKTGLTPIEEMQYAQLWHTIVGFAFIVIIIAHIYIGTLGMEGAFDAMGSGEVDVNWAREHHSIWAEKVEAEGDRPASGGAPARPTPAE